MCVRVCVCVRVCEREREKERHVKVSFKKRIGLKKGERERVDVEN